MSEFIAQRCPRCGSTLLSNGSHIWCSFVGSQGRGPVFEAPCTFGIDNAVVLKDVAGDATGYNHAAAVTELLAFQGHPNPWRNKYGPLITSKLREPTAAEVEALANFRVDLAETKVIDLLTSDPSMPLGTFNTFTSTTAPTLSLDQLVTEMNAFLEAQRENDDELAEALVEYIGRSGDSVDLWCERLGVSFADLVGILCGIIRPIPARFWNRVRAVFDPQRAPLNPPSSPDAPSN